MSSNKAIGIDKLKDSHLKLLLKYSEPVKEKVRMLITGWVNGLPIPAYFTVAKTFLLSKEETPYPKVGNVRIIAVLPSILKLYEQILLKQLRSELKQTIPLHPNQRGFVEGKCTMHNLADVIKVVNKCKEEIRTAITKKTPIGKRPKYYMLTRGLRPSMCRHKQQAVDSREPERR